ncbi:metalloregulator ArsR/SmtB family transcription factor [Xinfangfangia sp. CPCC 101601]|uniref:Metalloregulator ArsR/SmtB family transcription factor n=1 Tax=Pseudogemmobacter lacusdianii TaxID=3069608 RepID=A0ABU0W1W0_9RHOB|nr:metalloregulator ArsR/SmtB family transcription factor [Xinfangfangia sp. CPCC 101601]MDQ2067956.1 metalloregulator ArsR/SmtB family transcription factor [Xinfangfangia sp. CPCC 101601]
MTTAIDSLLPETQPLQARAAEATRFLKLLANQDRLMVVCALVTGERSVRDLEDSLGIRQPGLSQQIAGLREAGIIQGRKAGKHIFYHLADPKAAEVVATLYRLFCAPGAAEKEGSND